MTDLANEEIAGRARRAATGAERLALRHARSRRLQLFGVMAIALAILMLASLLWTMVETGYHAFTQTHVQAEIAIPSEAFPDGEPRSGNFREILRQSWLAQLPGLSTEEEKPAMSILSSGAELAVRQRVIDDPSLIGRTVEMSLPVSDPFDQFQKGQIASATPEANRRISDRQIELFDQLRDSGRVTTPFNWALFTNADSRFPELAGLKGALIGSFYALLVCFLLSFPIGIAAAIYLEEFAPKNRWTDLIEININNLAAVPSIVFGLLALAVFIGFLGLPRSVPLVGGMALALMTLPTIIIATRAALKAVPPSIREAALAVGASRLQTVFHHVVPLAMPGILTGTIIGMAQALGETAPLLLVGMNAFITSAPDSLLHPATALPTQIYIWADSPERGFTARTSAAILVLLGFMLCMNAVAIALRKILEKRW